MKNFTSVLIIAALVTLSGCATTNSPTPSGPTKAEQQKITVMYQAVQKRGGPVSQLYFAEMPSAGNNLADYLLVGVIKAGSPSNSMDALQELLKKVPGAQVVVYGGNDAVTAASVEEVLKLLPSSPGFLNTVLWVVQKEAASHSESLHAVAKLAGVRLEVVQIP